MQQHLTQTKTGAVVCKQNVSGNLVEYESLLFITNIPVDVTDEKLSEILNSKNMLKSNANCRQVLVRADINATSNEIWEQYNGLNDTQKVKSISYNAISQISF